jgi:hypothetical protein
LALTDILANGGAICYQNSLGPEPELQLQCKAFPP